MQIEKLHQDHLIEIINNLPLDERVAVYFYYIEKLDVSEIAEQLAISPDEVGERLTHARAKIKEDTDKDNNPLGAIFITGGLIAFIPILKNAMKTSDFPAEVMNIITRMNALSAPATAVTTATVPIKAIAAVIAGVVVTGGLVAGVLIADPFDWREELIPPYTVNPPDTTENEPIPTTAALLDNDDDDYFNMELFRRSLEIAELMGGFALYADTYDAHLHFYGFYNDKRVIYSLNVENVYEQIEINPGNTGFFEISGQDLIVSMIGDDSHTWRLKHDGYDLYIRTLNDHALGINVDVYYPNLRYQGTVVNGELIPLNMEFLLNYEPTTPPAQTEIVNMNYSPEMFLSYIQTAAENGGFIVYSADFARNWFYAFTPDGKMHGVNEITDDDVYENIHIRTFDNYFTTNTASFEYEVNGYEMSNTGDGHTYYLRSDGNIDIGFEGIGSSLTFLGIVIDGILYQDDNFTTH
ncbi:MAG: hypothetical protein FWD34_02380 [Oscillospiraceae bacterium]|nr:hypothetical protein [Oscillospiraceae bacterium]